MENPFIMGKLCDIMLSKAQDLNHIPSNPEYKYQGASFLDDTCIFPKKNVHVIVG